MNSSEFIPPVRCAACHGERLKFAWLEGHSVVFNCADCGASTIVRLDPPSGEPETKQ